MRGIIKYLPAAGAFFLGAGMEISGIQIPYLGYGLMGVGALLLLIPFWPKIRQLVSSDLEIKIIPNKWLEDVIVYGKPVMNPSYRLNPGHRYSATFGLILANHSESHKIRIDSAKILLRKKMLFRNGKTLSEMPLEIQNYPNNYILKDADIEAQSKKEYAVNTVGDLPIISPFPRKSRLILSLSLIGEKRQVEHILYEFIHDPKQVPDIPDWKKQ